MKGHGGVWKTMSQRSPIITGLPFSMSLKSTNSSSYAMPGLSVTTSDGQRVGPVVLGPDETTADGLPETTQKKSSKGIVRITKRLRLDLKWKGKNEPCK